MGGSWWEWGVGGHTLIQKKVVRLRAGCMVLAEYRKIFLTAVVFSYKSTFSMHCLPCTNFFRFQIFIDFSKKIKGIQNYTLLQYYNIVQYNLRGLPFSP